MIINPNYKKATNEAYKILNNYDGNLPLIDIMHILLTFPNIKLHTYSESAKKLNVCVNFYIEYFASSKHGFIVYNSKKKLYQIYYNDLEDESIIRFTLAHELGHIVLKHRIDDSISKMEANCFARNILCPVPFINELNIKSIYDYVFCFNVSPVMAEVSKSFKNSDYYYIDKDIYDNLSNKLHYYLNGYREII